MFLASVDLLLMTASVYAPSLLCFTWVSYKLKTVISIRLIELIFDFGCDKYIVTMNRNENIRGINKNLY